VTTDSRPSNNSRRRLPDLFVVAVLAVTVLVAGLGAMWAVITPGFRAPDEPHHLNTTLRLLDGGGWPEPGDGRFFQGTYVAAEEAGWVESGLELIRQNSYASPNSIWSGTRTPFASLVPDPVDPDDRTVILDFDGRVTLMQQVDQMTQHPPGYYALGAGMLKVLGGESWPWDDQLLALRFMDVLLMAGVVPLAVVTIRRLGGSRPAALIGAFAITAPSQYVYIAGSVTNDAALNLAGAGVVALSACVLTGRWNWRHVVGLGAVLGAGLMVKGFMLAFIPVVALAFLMSTGTSHALARRAWAAFVSLAVAFAVGGWWWLKNIVVYGTFQPSGYPPRPSLVDDSALSVTGFLRGAVENISRSTWGNYGWLESPWPQWLQSGLTTLALVLVALGVVLAGRSRRALLVLLVSWVGVLAVILYGAWAEYNRSGLFAGLQGRYLFVAIVPALAACGIAIARTTSPLARPLRLTLRLASLVVFLGLATYGLWFGFTSFYQAPGETFGAAISRWNEWSGFGIPKFALLTLGTAGLAVLALALAAIELWREPDGAAVNGPAVNGPADDSAAAPEPGGDLPAGAAEDLERAGVSLDAPGGSEEPDDAAVGQPRGDA
jgi:hypothetical protein